jgi:hypothetical protein
MLAISYLEKCFLAFVNHVIAAKNMIALIAADA